MTVSNDPVRFPTSPTPLSAGAADYRDSTVARAAMEAHDAVDRVAGSVGPIVDKVKDVAERTSRLMRGDDMPLTDVRDEALSALRVAVRKRPATAVTIALMLGWMMARAVSR